MAKQRGIVKLEGTIGDITFYKTADGYMAKENVTVSAERIASDPAFQRTRENMSEFGRAGKAGKVLRHAVRDLLQTAKDPRVASRLTGQMMKVIKADATSARGLRNVIDGEAELLQGFNFNNNAKLEATLLAPFTATINRVTGKLTASLQPFVPANRLTVPEGTTHFNVVSLGTAINFEEGTYETDVQETGILPVNSIATAAINLECSVAANSTHPLFLLLGIQFYQLVNGVSYPLKNGSFNALQVVKSFWRIRLIFKAGNTKMFSIFMPQS